LDTLEKKNDITKDVWLMFFEFNELTKGNIDNFEDDGMI